MGYTSYYRQRTYSPCVVTLLVLLGLVTAGLLGAALGTQYWLEGPSWNTVHQGDNGHYQLGLFGGESYTENANVSRTHRLWIVCSENGQCLYSCADNKLHRHEQLKWILANQPQRFDMDKYCSNLSPPRVDIQFVESEQYSKVDVILEGGEASLVKRELEEGKLTLVETDYGMRTPNELESEMENQKSAEMSKGENGTSRAQEQADEPNLACFALYIGCVACLATSASTSLLTSVLAIASHCLGAVGIYVSCILGALLSVGGISLWVVQVNSHLSHNVLVYNADEHWTTEGYQRFGLSFWLVVAASGLQVATLIISLLGRERHSYRRA